MMISSTRRAFFLWATGVGLLHVCLVLALNHFMLSGDAKMARVLFYLVAAAGPIGFISAARSISRIHRGAQRDDLREGTFPILWGAAFAFVVIMISILAY